MEDAAHNTTVLSKDVQALKFLSFIEKMFAPSIAPLDVVKAAIPTHLFVSTVQRPSAAVKLPSTSQTMKVYGFGHFSRTLEWFEMFA